MPCLTYGRRWDLVFQYDNGYNLPLECGGSEAKSRIGEQHGSNYMKEVLDVVVSTSTNDTDGIFCLDTCLEIPSVPPGPTTSSSTVYKD
ncbi:hypothetical protein MAM1_0285c09235 [Mucor ambiguus]|uniref:Uncharacterized protein n=1 Tax=Mucor ambiguus TaxID=91626 RepID=A0A0C9N563_9FUNG|nr:hypothetical protein MAM1_0285c09235 [Mucor ambiguus]